MERPILPAPHQILKDMNKSILQRKVTSKRSLVYHGWVTISSTLVGFGIGALLGIVLAVGIVYIPTLNRSVMPWIIASQTIPILAIAPMIIFTKLTSGWGDDKKFFTNIKNTRQFF